jgi:lysyl-tRNA synthetase class II
MYLFGQAPMDARTGKITISPEGLQALRKCLQLLPNGYYGVTDVRTILEAADPASKDK